MPRSALSTAPRESTLVASILRDAKALHGVRLLKYHGSPYSLRGHPDLYGSAWGRAVFLEVKTERGRLTLHQERELVRWRSAGAFCAVVRSRKDAAAFFERVRRYVVEPSAQEDQ